MTAFDDAKAEAVLETTLARLEDAAKALRDAPIGVLEMPDASGRVRAVEVMLSKTRQGWNAATMLAAKDPESAIGPSVFPPLPAERTAYGTVKPRVVGRAFRTVTKRSATRTYNVAAILGGTAKALNVSPLEALMLMIKDGPDGLPPVARVEIVWTPFEAFAKRHGLPLKVVEGVVADDGNLDGPWVGEVWKVTVSQEAVKDDGTPAK